MTILDVSLVILIILKLFGLITISWWLVFTPLWVFIALILLISAIKGL